MRRIASLAALLLTLASPAVAQRPDRDAARKAKAEQKALEKAIRKTTDLVKRDSGLAAPSLFRALADSESAVRVAAMASLGYYVGEPATKDELQAAKRLKGDSLLIFEMRRRMARAPKLAPLAQDLLVTRGVLTESGDSVALTSAIWLLNTPGVEDIGSSLVLAHVARHSKSARVRLAATEVLRHAPHTIDRTIPGLTALVSDHRAKRDERLNAALALELLAPRAAGATETLLAVHLDDEDSVIALRAGSILAAIGPVARPELERILRYGSSAELRQGAAIGLGALDGGVWSTSRVLLDAALDRSEDHIVRAAALAALGRVGLATVDLTELERLSFAKNEDATLRILAREALGGPGASESAR